ncbi:hypothetical protein [Pseudoalteromonas pernae]|uniref:hypothetical protein n=1 Tax=Pseudoalteromonas pernae TaxID=3118054 RepID=UPI0032425251
MNNDELLPDIPTDDKREAYYRACIMEFERLGYRDQFLNEISEDLEEKMKKLKQSSGK